MRDGLSSGIAKRCISPTYLATGDTPFVGEIIDHQGYDAAAYEIATGELGDANATFAVLLEEGDDSGLSDAADVADADMVSQTPGTAPETAAGFDYSHDDEVRRLGYIGTKRYTRLTITPSGNTGNVYLGAICVLSKRGPGTAKTAQPSA